jgi:hypothetical protein
MSQGVSKSMYFFVQGVPEMIVGGADDLVERVGAGAVAIQIEHGLEIVRRDGVVHGVLGDVSVGHNLFSLAAISRQFQSEGANEMSQEKMTGASRFSHRAGRDSR